MRFYNLIILAVLLACAACIHQPVQPVQTEPIGIDSATFESEIAGYDGFALVLFYNSEYWQCRNMEERFDLFARQYGDAAKFCKFHWTIGDD